MNNNQTEAVVQRFLAALTQRNLGDLVALFAEHIDWYIPGNQDKALWLGKRNSRAQVQEFYETLWKHTEPISASIDKIFVDANDVVITGSFSTKMLQTNKKVDSLFSIQMRVEDDLIVKYRLLEDSYAVFVALNR